MNDKELAEKVAEKLGWLSTGQTGWYVPEEMLDWDYPVDCIIHGRAVFTWSTFGLMVEDAERRGWRLKINRGWISFYKPAMFNQNETDPLEWDATVKACALAYVEIPDKTKPDDGPRNIGQFHRNEGDIPDVD
jgi:hypothetical protein